MIQNLFISAFRFVKLLISIVFLICLVIFMVNNRTEIAVDLYPLPFVLETKLFLTIIFFFILGILFGIFAVSGSLFRKTLANFRSKIQIKKLEKKLKTIK